MLPFFFQLMDFAQGKIVLALEGGYNLASIANSALACMEVLLNDKPVAGSSEIYPFESTWRVIQEVGKKRICLSLACIMQVEIETFTDTETNSILGSSRIKVFLANALGGTTNKINESKNTSHCEFS